MKKYIRTWEGQYADQKIKVEYWWTIFVLKSGARLFINDKLVEAKECWMQCLDDLNGEVITSIRSRKVRVEFSANHRGQLPPDCSVFVDDQPLEGEYS